MELKVKSLLLMGALVCSLGFMASCSSSDDTSDAGGGGGNLPPTPVVDPTLTQAYLCGFARMSNGNPATYITVTTGSATTTTDQNGFFEFKRIKIVDGRVVVKFSADYIQDVVRSFEYKQGEVWDVVLLENYQASSSLPSKSESYASTTDKQISVTNTAKDFKVDLQKDGYKDAATGEAYSGTVNASVTYLNPDDEENFADQMPGGDLAAKDQNGEPVQLVSYGMTCVNLEGGGKKLQLADGKPAKAHFPIPETLKNDPRVINHENIPLWSFNESTGLWEYEGEATYDAEAGDYVGSVKHFSWANLDWPESRATVKGKVTDGEGKALAWQRVHVGQKIVSTDAEGKYECYVPANTSFDISVRGSDYGNYTADGSDMVKAHVSGIPAKTEKVVNLSLPTLCKITGKIKNNGTGGNEATVWIEYTYSGSTKHSRRVRSASDGSFTLLVPTYATGNATLKVTAANATTIQKSINLTGESISVGTIEILSNVAESGKLTVTVKGTGQTFSFDVPNADLYSFNGVRILNDRLSCSIESRSNQMNGGWINGSIVIDDGFSTSKTSYTNVQFNYGGEMMNPEATDKHEGYWLQIASAYGDTHAGARCIKANVTVQNGKATFTFNDDVFFQYHSFNDENEGINPTDESTPNATLTGTITMDVFYQAETVTQAAYNDSRIPSWAPRLAGQDVHNAFFITNSAKLGKGASYSYYLPSTDERADAFATLHNQVKALGYTLYDYRDDGYYSEVYYTYYSGDKFVKIHTDTYALKERTMFFGIGGNVDVYVLDGTIFDVADFTHDSWGWGPFVKGDKAANAQWR
jgi:hypothetical protein